MAAPAGCKASGCGWGKIRRAARPLTCLQQVQAGLVRGWGASLGKTISLLSFSIARIFALPRTLDILSGGRAYLGIGAAWYEDEAKGFGIPYPSTSERFEQLEDNLRLAKALWASDETSFAGTHFAAPAITNNPRPLSTPHPRIMIGGTGPKKTLRMVAQYADACNIGDWVGKENMQKALDTLKAHCQTLGRDYASVEKTSLGTVHLSAKDTAASTINRIQELAAMGFTHAIFNMPDVYKITPLEIFANEIIPAVA